MKIFVSEKQISKSDFSIREPGFGLLEQQAELETVLEMSIEDFILWASPLFLAFVEDERRDPFLDASVLAKLGYPDLHTLMTVHPREFECFFIEYLMADLLTSEFNSKGANPKYLLCFLKHLNVDAGSVKMAGCSYLRG